MSSYKDLLMKALLDNGWEQTEINEEGIDWWSDEVWKIKSNKQQWGLELYLTFLVDPQWDIPRNKGQGIWAILATKGIPQNWSQQPDKVAQLCMSKRKFNVKLNEFINEINDFRNSSCFRITSPFTGFAGLGPL